MGATADADTNRRALLDQPKRLRCDDAGPSRGFEKKLVLMRYAVSRSACDVMPMMRGSLGNRVGS